MQCYRVQICSDKPIVEVEVPMCATLGYNQTNVRLSPFNLASQKEAGMEIYTYYPLVQISCAEGIHFSNAYDMYSTNCTILYKQIFKVKNAIKN